MVLVIIYIYVFFCFFYFFYFFSGCVLELQESKSKIVNLESEIHLLKTANYNLNNLYETTNRNLIEAQKRVVKVVHCICGRELSVTQIPTDMLDDKNNVKRKWSINGSNNVCYQCSLCSKKFDGNSKLYQCPNKRIKKLGKHHYYGFTICLQCADGNKTPLTQEEMNDKVEQGNINDNNLNVINQLSWNDNHFNELISNSQSRKLIFD